MSKSLYEHVLIPKINEDTGIFTGTFNALMTCLSDAFGNITDQNLNEERQKLVNHTYVHSDFIANVFNVISNYTTMLDAHGTTETNEQRISMGRIIITTALIFAESVGKWDKNSLLKIHFPTSRLISQLLK